MTSPMMCRKRDPRWSHGCSLGIGRETKSSDDALEIVAPIKFDLNPAAFLAMIIPRANTERLVQMLTTAGAEVTARFFDAGHALTNTELVQVKRWLTGLTPL